MELTPRFFYKGCAHGATGHAMRIHQPPHSSTHWFHLTLARIGLTFINHLTLARIGFTSLYHALV